MAKFKFFVATNYVGSKEEEEVEIDDSELEGLSAEEREAYVENEFKEWMWDNIDAGFCEIGDAS